MKRAIEDEHECGEVVFRITTARGALGSFMAEVVEGHIGSTWWIRDARPRRVSAVRPTS